MLQIEGLKLKTKLLLMVLPMLLGLLLLATMSLQQQWALMQDARQVAELTGFATRASALVHELQKERGMSAGYIGSRGGKFGDKLPGQRKAVDERQTALQAFLPGFRESAGSRGILDRIDGASAQLDRLPQIRKQIDAMTISVKDEVAYFTGVIALLFDAVDLSGQATTDAGFARAMRAYYAALQAKESAGIERAVLSDVFARDRLGPGDRDRMVTLEVRQQVYTDLLLRNVSPSQAAEYQSKVRGPAVDEVKRMREIGAAASRDPLAATGKLGVDAEHWFAMATQRIGLLKAFEDSLTATILNQAEQARSQARQQFLVLLATVTGLILLASLIGAIAIRGIYRQIGGEPEQVMAVARRIAAGDLSLGGTTADSNATQSVHTGILGAMHEMAGRLRGIVSEVLASAESLAGSSREVNAAAATLSDGSSQQAAGVENTSAAVEELNATVQKNLETSRATDSVANAAAREAARGGDAVRQTVAAMKSIAAKIDLVEDIAYKTNLLSLNAAIEAARAGKHGKGFTVVAAEVRRLAESSREAAQEISELADESMSVAENTGRLLESIVPDIQRTATMVQEITAASGEQARGVLDINEAMSTLNHVTQQNAAASEELAATSAELNSQASRLQETVAYFRLTT